MFPGQAQSSTFKPANHLPFPALAHTSQLQKTQSNLYFQHWWTFSWKDLFIICWRGEDGRPSLLYLCEEVNGDVTLHPSTSRAHQGKRWECVVLKMLPLALRCSYAEAITCDMGHVGDAKEGGGGVWAAFSYSSTPPSTMCDVGGNTMVFSPPLQAAYTSPLAPLHSPSSVAHVLADLPPMPHLPLPPTVV